MASPKRIRRSRAASKQTILEASEQLMLAEGPAAVRVQRVAGLVGVTDAAVHYHFGSREGLLEALLRHCGRRLVRDISMADAAGPGLDLPAVSRAMTATYVNGGAARMMMWLALSGWRPQGSGMFSGLVDRAQARRPDAARDETRYLIALLNAAHVSQAILGEAMLRAVGAEWDEAGQGAFLDWVTRLVDERLGVPTSPSTSPPQPGQTHT